MTWGPDEVRDVEFRRSGLVRRGYDRKQVDAFLDRIEGTLRGSHHKPVTSRDLVTVLFRRVPAGRSGYDCRQVDEFLQNVAPAIFRVGAGRVTVFGKPAAASRNVVPAQRVASRRWLSMFAHRDA
jgi:DivIVA domain-containing protein